MTARTREATLLESPQCLAERYDVALLDLDGVVYLAEQPVPGAAAALAAARERGMRLAFVTNNASRTPDQVADLLAKVGVPADPAEVVTSAQAAAHYLADRLPAGSPVLVLGTTGLVQAVTERGLRPVFTADDRPAAVVQGFFPDITWRNLAEAAVAIRHGAFWLATNSDATVPSPRGPLPGNGALVAALQHALGRPPAATTGKPDPSMHAESVERSGARTPVVVGDRLDTDIEGATRVGCPSLLVLTGVSTPAMLLTAAPAYRPDYLGRDLAALLQPHPPVTAGDQGELRCGTARVRADGGGLLLAGVTEELDGLRALAVAAWRAADAGRPIDGIRGRDGKSNTALRNFELAG
jgi:HAD superfamily hydrolase (TIGR01450 family)